MYFQPYGDEQQLNLNWIINEIINLHKQLDPDYETPSFTQVYPYSNLNRLNLDWVLSELKALKELAPEPAPVLDIQAVAEALVALPFDSSKSYQIYDYISREGEIWRATEAISAGGVWDETKWFKTKLGTDLAVLDRWINAINADLTTLQNTIEDLSSDEISDDSDAGGATIKQSLNNLKGSLNPWKGKKIVWYGTSISAGGYIGKTNPNAIPQKIGIAIGANVINEAIGSSCVHCKQSSMYNASTNPYGFWSHKFEHASRCLSNSKAELQWIIDNYTFFSDAPSSLSNELKAQILANGYQSKIDPYLTASTFPDLFVFEHGFNDVINGF